MKKVRRTVVVRVDSRVICSELPGHVGGPEKRGASSEYAGTDNVYSIE